MGKFKSYSAHHLDLCFQQRLCNSLQRLLRQLVSLAEEVFTVAQTAVPSEPTLYAQGRKPCQTSLLRSHYSPRHEPAGFLIILSGRSRHWLTFFSGYPLLLQVHPQIQSAKLGSSRHWIIGL